MTGRSVLPWGRPLTYDDLAALPDDGHRYELVDGVLLVSPSPVTCHQRAVGRLHLLLDGACPPELEVFLAPFDVVLAHDTVLQPDLLVARRDDLTDRNLPAAPVLAVEVLSPSTRRFDLLLKRSRLEEARCEVYLVVDPDEPSARVWRLDGDAYVEAGAAVGDETLRLRGRSRLTSCLSTSSAEPPPSGTPPPPEPDLGREVGEGSRDRDRSARSGRPGGGPMRTAAAPGLTW